MIMNMIIYKKVRKKEKKNILLFISRAYTQKSNFKENFYGKR